MKKYTFILFIITSIYCQAQKLGEDILNLEKISFDLDIDSFYSDNIKIQEKFVEQRTQIHLKGTKTQNDYGDELVESWEFHSISIDSIYQNKIYDLKNLIGIQYNMDSWSSNDSLAFIEKMYFQKIQIMKSPTSEFMGLVSYNGNTKKEEFKYLINSLTKKYGQPETSKNYWLGNFYIYKWKLNNRILYITPVVHLEKRLSK